MKKYFNILTVILVLLTSSCSSGNGGETVVEESCELIVTLSAKLPDKTVPVSRSGEIWGDPYPEQQGLPDESAINSLSLYLVNSENEILSLPAVLKNSSDGKYVYKISLRLHSDFVTLRPNGTYSLTGRIVALANYPGEGTQATPFGTPAYDVKHIKESRIIPMWGVTTVDNVTIIKEATVDIGNIELLRSIPKITIRLADEIKDIYEIKSVVPSTENFNTTAMCQPTGCTTVSYTKDLEIEGCYNGSDDMKGTVTDFYMNGAGNELWFYPAERLCPVGTDGTPEFFTVTLHRKNSTDAPFTGRVYLCDYHNGSPDFQTAFERIVRNHNYEYKVSLRELQFIISFREWIFGGKEHLELE